VNCNTLRDMNLKQQLYVVASSDLVVHSTVSGITRVRLSRGARDNIELDDTPSSWAFEPSYTVVCTFVSSFDTVPSYQRRLSTVLLGTRWNCSKYDLVCQL